MLGALVLAAGRSRRFGSADKLLAPVRGAPMLAHALAAAALPEIEVRLAAVSSGPVAALVQAQGVLPVRIPAEAPQSASLVAGLAQARALGVTRLLVLLGDMPFIGRAEIEALLNLAGNDAACATDGRAPLPPAVFPQRLFPALAQATGDRGARDLLRQIPKDRRLALPPGTLRDIDRPEDI